MSVLELLLLAAGGLVAGIVNTLAGGGSLLTVPLLVAFGLPGRIANGTNRIGILTQSLAAARGFQSHGIPGLKESLPILPPVLLGGLAGALGVAQLSDAAFERSFGLVMLVLLLPTLRPPRPDRVRGKAAGPWARFALFSVIGLYGGAFQAGVGVLLVLALAAAGYDLVLANSIKIVVTLAFTLVAIPVFLIEGQIAWTPALVMAGGFALGGELGVRLAVAGGEKIIRPMMMAAVVALAGKMLGFY